jgi:tRNA-splicing ligase RtcB (3'-phosphate/5'-hydroxy nucleic acid ligase)
LQISQDEARKHNMNTKDLIQIGVPQGEPIKCAQAFILAFRASGGDISQLENEIGAIVGNPSAFLGDPMREAFARSLYVRAFKQRETLAPGNSGVPVSSLRR